MGPISDKQRATLTKLSTAAKQIEDNVMDVEEVELLRSAVIKLSQHVQTLTTLILET